MSDPNLIMQARAALADSDLVALRNCLKTSNPVPYPAAWEARDNALRQIISTGTGTIPDYPRNQDGTIAYP